MPGVRMLQSVGPAPTTDTQYVWLELPAGSYLVLAGGRNQTKGGQRVTLLLAPAGGISRNTPVVTQAGPADYLPLQGDTWQKGPGDWVMYHGRLLIRQDLNILIASFFGPTTGDSLRLVAGVED